jgi:hypothetical protein
VIEGVLNHPLDWRFNTTPRLAALITVGDDVITPYRVVRFLLPRPCHLLDLWRRFDDVVINGIDLSPFTLGERLGFIPNR